MERPWSKRAEELAESEGYWADYAAFWEWFDEKDGTLGTISDCEQISDTIDVDQKIQVYRIFCAAFRVEADSIPSGGAA